MSDQRSTSALSSKVQLDGVMNKIPGMATGNWKSDQRPIDCINCPYTNLYGGAATTATYYLAPVDYLIVGVYVNVDVVPGTGAATIGIGVSTDTDRHLDDYSVGTAHATGFTNLTANAAFTGSAGYSSDLLGSSGSQGDLVLFQTDGGGTATGKAVWGCVVLPR